MAQIYDDRAWADGGAPEGDPGELPPLPRFAEGWQIGKPDQVFEMLADFEIPAKGAVDYQYFEVPTNFTEDRWMQAGEVRAGNPGHVHHIIVYVKEAEAGRAAGRGHYPADLPGRRDGRQTSGTGARRPRPRRQPARRTVQAAAQPRARGPATRCWSTGQSAKTRQSYPAGMAKRIPAGSTLIFQVHYTTNGTAGRDRSSVGLIFSKEPPQREMRTALIANTGSRFPRARPTTRSKRRRRSPRT